MAANLEEHPNIRLDPGDCPICGRRITGMEPIRPSFLDLRDTRIFRHDPVTAMPCGHEVTWKYTVTVTWKYTVTVTWKYTVTVTS